MSLITGDRSEDPRTTARAVPRRHSVFATPNTPADAAAADVPDERTPWNGDVNRQAAIERATARRNYALTQSGHLPIVDSDGRIVPTPEMVARQAAWDAEKAEAEAKRLADLTPDKLDAKQVRRWQDWEAAYELHRPDFVRLSIGPRGEMLARQNLTPFEWVDEDERHPEGGRVIVRGMLTPPVAERPRAYPSERVLAAVREQLLDATWLPEESHKPTPPKPRPTTIDENLAAMADEREARASAKRRSDYNWNLIVKGGYPR